MTEDATLLLGIVGSTAYGLQRPGSDVDRLGVFATSAREIAGWSWTEKRQTRATHEPDVTLHEVRKFLKLVLNANPTVTELLWLDAYEQRSDLGNWMIELRTKFLSRPRVENAYIGYAWAQVKRLEARGDSFSSDVRNRTAKHARHMLRLLRQGRQLLDTGELSVRVTDPDEYWRFDAMEVPEMLSVFEHELQLTKSAANASPLPERANEEAAAAVLDAVRRRHP